MATACATASPPEQEIDVAIKDEIKEKHALYDKFYNSRQLEKVVDSIYAEDCCVMMEGRDVIRGRKGQLGSLFISLLLILILKSLRCP